jgi:molybdenum cofactor guanylyltransferase
MSEADVVAIVLAGGASSRFGSDKLAADLGGRSLLHHALEAVGSASGSIVVVVAPDAPEPRLPPALAGRVRVARDQVAHAGPLAGLAAGLAAIRDEPPGIALVVGGDMPGLVPGVLRLLVERLAADPKLAAMTLAASPAAPLPMAVRPVIVSTAVETCLATGRRSLRALLVAVPAAELSSDAWRALDPRGSTLSDVDRPDDLAWR